MTRLLLTGRSEKEIADALGSTLGTTHNHVGQIFRKFGVRSRAELTAIWLGHPTASSPARNCTGVMLTRGPVELHHIRHEHAQIRVLQAQLEIARLDPGLLQEMRKQQGRGFLVLQEYHLVVLISSVEPEKPGLRVFGGIPPC